MATAAVMIENVRVWLVAALTPHHPSTPETR